MSIKVHWLCRFIGHRWIQDWYPVGHVEGAYHRWCRRGCGVGQMRYREATDATN